MKGHQYNRATKLLTVDVPHWDGETQPDDPNEVITGVPTDNTAGFQLHKFDEETQTWGEGMPQAELDVVISEQSKQQAASDLAATDKEMARIGEDIFDYLIATDPSFSAAMPKETKDKIAQRKNLRGKLSA